MKIVVPLDMSETAGRALGLAADVARGLGDQLLLVTVNGQRLRHDLSSVSTAEGVPIPEMIEAYLKSTVAELDGVAAGYSVLAGVNAPEALIDFVDNDAEVRMVVMATHGRTGLDKWRLGNVTERVVRHANVPVMVVPRTSR